MRGRVGTQDVRSSRDEMAIRVALPEDRFAVLRERHATANNVGPMRTFGRGEPLVFALFPDPCVRAGVPLLMSESQT